MISAGSAARRLFFGGDGAMATKFEKKIGYNSAYIRDISEIRVV